MGLVVVVGEGGGRGGRWRGVGGGVGDGGVVGGGVGDGGWWVGGGGWRGCIFVFCNHVIIWWFGLPSTMIFQELNE